MRDNLKYTTLLNFRDTFLATHGEMESYSDSTIGNYKATTNLLDRFLREYLGVTPRVEHLTVANVKAFWQSVSGKADQSRSVYRTRLDVICSWGVREGYFIKNPIDAIPKVKEPQAKRNRPRLKIGQLEEFTTYIDSLDPRTRALLLFLLRSGRRRSEVQHFFIRDLDLGDDRFEFGSYVYTEKKKHGVRVRQPLDELTRAMLDHYLIWYKEQAVRQFLLTPEQPLPEGWAVFPPYMRGGNDNLNPRGGNVMGNITVTVRRTAEAMGIYEEGWATHALRRFAGDYLAANYGILAAKVLYNHASERTTEKYLDREREKTVLAAALKTAWGRTLEPTPQAAVPPPEPQPAIAEGGAQVISIFGRKRTG